MFHNVYPKIFHTYCHSLSTFLKSANVISGAHEGNSS